MKTGKDFMAEKIRQSLECRVAEALECKPSDLPRIKIGTLVHFLFLLKGSSEELGGFHTSMSAVLQLLGHETVWDIEQKEVNEGSAPEEIVN
jgi:hypothetical protein